jgi:hypothetical protein
MITADVNRRIIADVNKRIIAVNKRIIEAFKKPSNKSIPMLITSSRRF